MAFLGNADVGDEHLPPTLHGVNFRIRKGAHVAVCGQVKSGKNVLLACMLGEISKLEGTNLKYLLRWSGDLNSLGMLWHFHQIRLGRAETGVDRAV